MDIEQKINIIVKVINKMLVNHKVTDWGREFNFIDFNKYIALDDEIKELLKELDKE